MNSKLIYWQVYTLTLFTVLLVTIFLSGALIGIPLLLSAPAITAGFIGIFSRSKNATRCLIPFYGYLFMISVIRSSIGKIPRTINKLSLGAWVVIGCIFLLSAILPHDPHWREERALKEERDKAVNELIEIQRQTKRMVEEQIEREKSIY